MTYVLVYTRYMLSCTGMFYGASYHCPQIWWLFVLNINIQMMYVFRDSVVDSSSVWQLLPPIHKSNMSTCRYWYRMIHTRYYIQYQVYGITTRTIFGADILDNASVDVYRRFLSYHAILFVVSGCLPSLLWRKSAEKFIPEKRARVNLACDARGKTI